MRLGGVEKERVEVCSAPNANAATRGLGCWVAGLLFLMRRQAAIC